jgi:hypothetical protein
MKFRIKSLFSLLLLLYFAGFAVAPVSAVLPSEQLFNIGDDHDFLRKRTDRTDIFLYDLALWEVLKKVKRSDDAILSSLKNSDALKNSPVHALWFVMDAGNAVSIPLPGISAYYHRNISAAQQYPHFDHSGLSPPFSA